MFRLSGELDTEPLMDGGRGLRGVGAKISGWIPRGRLEGSTGVGTRPMPIGLDDGLLFIMGVPALEALVERFI